MEKYFKNKVELRKSIKEILINNGLKINNCNLKVCCYSSDDNIELTTNLEIQFYKDDTYMDVVVFSSVTSEQDNTRYYDIIDSHISILDKDKKDLYTYLKKNSYNVELSDNFTQ